MFGAAATVVVALIAAVQSGSNLVADSKPSNQVLPRPVAAAGDWLHRHNTGGTIISTPDMNKGITNRAERRRTLDAHSNWSPKSFLGEGRRIHWGNFRPHDSLDRRHARAGGT